MVVAGIGAVWPALHTRSIEIKMRRRRGDEIIQPLTSASIADLERLGQIVSGWALDNVEALRAATPAMPVGIINRARDNWHPLLALADRAGGHWPELVRSAATALSGETEDQSIGAQLLFGIRRVFEAMRGVRISSDNLCRALRDLEDVPWSEDACGLVLTAKKLAAELKPFGISPRVFREGNRTPRGYAWDQFEDAFARYLPPSP